MSIVSPLSYQEISSFHSLEHSFSGENGQKCAGGGRKQSFNTAGPTGKWQFLLPSWWSSESFPSPCDWKASISPRLMCLSMGSSKLVALCEGYGTWRAGTPLTKGSYWSWEVGPWNFVVGLHFLFTFCTLLPDYGHNVTRGSRFLLPFPPCHDGLCLLQTMNPSFTLLLHRYLTTASRKTT